MVLAKAGMERRSSSSSKMERERWREKRQLI